MTPEEFESLLSLLDPNRERAGERYEDIRRRLIRLFALRGCESPEDLADETFNRVARKAAQKGFVLLKPDPYSFICGVAYRVKKEEDRKLRKIPFDWETFDRPDPGPPAREPEDRNLDLLERCLDRLPPDQRQLVLDYDAAEDHIRARQELAAKRGIGLNALRIKVFRLRQQLKECMEARGR